MKPDLDIKPYLYVAVKNTALNKLKVNRRKADVEETSINPLYVENRTAEDNMEYNEMEQVLMDTIAELPPKCQEVFRLSRFEEMSYKEIAAELDISVKTVENQMGKALKRLREALERYKKLIVLLLFTLFSNGI